MKILRPLLLTFTLFASHTCYCPPLVAPKTTDLKCEDPVKFQRVNCSSSWLPDGTVAYFTCPSPDSKKRAIKGRIRCSEDGVHRQDRGIGNYYSVHLPCGITRDDQKPEIHVYSYQAPLHYGLTGKADPDYRLLGEHLHNKFRLMHGSQPLRLEANLSRQAQHWADKISATGRLDMAPGFSFGQNIFLAPDTNNLTDAVNDAVQNWYHTGYSEYNWDDIAKNWHNSLSLDFSQLVWNNSRFLGIGASSLKSGKGAAVIAFYDPSGNMIVDGDEESSDGLFKLNVFPLQVNHTL